MTWDPDRSECNRALAKVIAYQNVGKQREAKQWFRDLAQLLGYSDLLKSTRKESLSLEDIDNLLR